MSKETSLDWLSEFKREMEQIDLDALAAEFGMAAPKLPESTVGVVKPLTTKTESTRCKTTDKIQFATAPLAQAALKHWKMVDPSICWDLKRIRIYKCKKCHQFHMGKDYGILG